MLCCGSDSKTDTNTDELLNNLRKDDGELKVNLNDCHMEFKSNKGKWESKFFYIIIYFLKK